MKITLHNAQLITKSDETITSLRWSAVQHRILRKPESSGSEPGCCSILRCHLQCPGVLWADTFFNISLKIYFQNVTKPLTKLLWVLRHRCRKPKKVGNHCFSH